jgi:hypothetical protein
MTAFQATGEHIQMMALTLSGVALALALRRKRPKKQAAGEHTSGAVALSVQTPREFATATCQLECRDVAVIMPGDLDQFVATQRKHLWIEFLQTPFGVPETQQRRDFVMGQHRTPRQWIEDKADIVDG